MIISISPLAIAATVRAIAALEMLTATESDRLLLAPLLERERPEPLTMIITDAIASMLLEILPYVDDTGLSEHSGDAPVTVSLRVPYAPDGSASLIRRRMEHLATLRVLETVFLSVAPQSGIADKFTSRAEIELSSLLSLLQSPVAPFTRRPAW